MITSNQELAFIYNTTRHATVTSLTNMELISIGRQDYVDMFMSAAKEELPDHVKYLATCSFTKGWPIEKLKKYSTACQVHYYRRGEVIVKNTTKCDFIYVVRSVGGHFYLEMLNCQSNEKKSPIKYPKSKGKCDFSINSFQAKIYFYLLLSIIVKYRYLTIIYKVYIVFKNKRVCLF